MNPYWGKDFFSFIWLFFKRLGKSSLVSDEIQIYVLSCIAVSCAIVGAFLVFRKMTMLANALSHTILLGIVIAYLCLSSTAQMMMGTLGFTHLFFAALIAAFFTSFLTEFLTKALRLQEDASIGLVFSTLFALGIAVVTLFTRNVHLGTEVIMGNVDGLHRDDISGSALILLINLTFICVFFRGYFSTTFDPGFSKTIGISPSFYHYLLMLQTAFTAVGAFRAIGVFLVLSLLVGPVLIARLFTHHFKKLLILASCLGIFFSFVSVALARHILSVYQIALSTTGIMITLIFLSFLFSVGLSTAIKRRNKSFIKLS